MFKIKGAVPKHEHRISDDTGRCVTCGKTPEEIRSES